VTRAPGYQHADPERRLTDSPQPLSYQKPRATRPMWRLARLLLLADALIMGALGATGIFVFGVLPRTDLCDRFPWLPPLRGAEDGALSIYLICSVGVALVGAFFFYSFLKLATRVQRAVSVARRCAMGTAATCLSTIAFIAFAWFSRAFVAAPPPPPLLSTYVVVALAVAGFLLMLITAEIAARAHREAAAAERALSPDPLETPGRI
jgi:hypothetical protein